MNPNRWEMQHFKTSDGLRIAYVVDDYADRWKPKDTVILVHAAMGSSRRFYAWVPHLARDFRVVRLDMRGHGESQVPAPAQLTSEALVRDVVELADHLGCPHFHVVGSSAGAVVSQKVAVDYPDRVITLASFAAAPGIKHGNQDHAQWVKRIGEKGVAAFLRETIADRMDTRAVDPGFVDWFIGESARTPVELLARFVPMMRGFDVMDEISRIECPTLAVVPGADPIHRVDQYRVLADRIKRCEFLVYEGLPHNITDAVPDRCAQDLKSFLLKHRRSQ
jgi:3-oxoadipate enol-lactonase